MRKLNASLAATLAFLDLVWAPVAQAQDLLLTGAGKPGTVAPAFSITHTANPNSGSINTTNVSISSVASGTADAHRVIVIALYAVGGVSHTLTALTFNGVNIFGGCFIVDNFTKSLDVCEGVVASGTTGTLAATYSNAVTRFSADVWAVYNANGDAHSQRSGATPTSSAANNVAIASTTIDTNGIALSAAMTNTNGSTYSWAQSAGASGNIDSDQSNGTSLTTSGYRVTPGASPVQYTATYTGGNVMRGATFVYKP